MTSDKPFIPLDFVSYSEAEMLERSESYYKELNKRRTVRTFSDKPVPRQLIETIIKTASTAPSGAHKQPWTFCAVSSPVIKSKIRAAAEEEEHTNYHGRMSDAWLEDLKAFGTDEHKPFLETVPWLIVVFRRVYEFGETGKENNYYVNESVGLATGMLLSAIHHAGLASLTHTPSPMKFLEKVLDRPENERAFLLIPVGYPVEGTTVPDLERKPLEEVAVFYE